MAGRKNRKLAYAAILLVLLAFSFQNCGSPFSALDENAPTELRSGSLEIDSQPNMNAGQILSTQGIGSTPNLRLFTETNQLLNSGSAEAVLPISPQGEAILAWRATNQPSSCVLLGKLVPSEGGPAAFQNLVAGQRYLFDCQNSSGRTVLTLIARTMNWTDRSYASGPVDVFIIAGQSNAFGQSIEGQLARPGKFKASRFLEGRMQRLNALGAWAAFAERYVTITGRAIVFVPTSVGGTGSNTKSDLGSGHWGPEGNLLTNSINQTRTALSSLREQGFSPTLRGVLWVQGENDAIAINLGKQTQQDFSAATNAVLRAYRNGLGSDLNFFVFQTGTALDESDIGFRAVRLVQAGLVAQWAKTSIVYDRAATFPARGLMWDTYHYMPAGYTEMGRDAATRVATVLASAGTPIPVPPSPTPPIFCTAGTVDGRTQAIVEEGITLSWNSSPHFAEIGQKNKVFDASNVLIGQTNSVVSWGKSPGSKLFSAVSLSKDLTPILLMTEKVRVDYEVHGGTSSSWQKCGKTVSVTWTRPPVSYGQCVIPDGYQTSCGGANVKVFRGGVCQVQKGPVAEEIGKVALCNANLSWEFVTGF